MQNIRERLKKEREETVILLGCIPATVVTLFVVSVICMNLLANKTLYQNLVNTRGCAEIRRIEEIICT